MPREVIPFRVTLEPLDGILVAAVAGDLEFGTAAELGRVVREGLDPDLDGLVVDLTDVGFMDSTGTAVLLNLRLRCTRQSLPFALVCPPGPALRVLEVTGLRGTLRDAPDRDQAVAVIGELRARGRWT